MPPKKENHTKVLLNIPNEMLEKVDEYRFKHRFNTRLDALNSLIEKGLEREEKEEAK